MIQRKRHSNKEIEIVILFAENHGWRYKKAGNSAHAWGRLLCPFKGRGGCSMSIWSTPRNTETHAKRIMRAVKKCVHQHEE